MRQIISADIRPSSRTPFLTVTTQPVDCCFISFGPQTNVGSTKLKSMSTYPVRMIVFNYVILQIVCFIKFLFIVERERESPLSRPLSPYNDGLYNEGLDLLFADEDLNLSGPPQSVDFTVIIYGVGVVRNDINFLKSAF